MNEGEFVVISYGYDTVSFQTKTVGGFMRPSTDKEIYAAVMNQ